MGGTMHSESETQWEPCPHGTIVQMVSSIKTRCRRRQAGRVAVMSLMLVGIGVAGWLMTTQQSEYEYGGIVCSEVRRLAPGYLSGKLDEDTSRQIAVHLSLCPTCGPTMQEMRESMHVSWTPCSAPFPSQHRGRDESEVSSTFCRQDRIRWFVAKQRNVSS